jgi:hypothetical protein
MTDITTTVADSVSKDAPVQKPADTTDAASNSPDSKDLNKSDPPAGSEPKEKKKPYVNPERVKTGGAPRVCTLPSTRTKIQL